MTRRDVCPVHDTRVVVVALAAATAGYAPFGRYIRDSIRLDELPDERVEDALAALLQDVAWSAFRQ